MTFRSSLAIAAGITSLLVVEAHAICDPGDFVCRKFSASSAADAPTSVKPAPRRVYRARKPRPEASQTAATPPEPASAPASLNTTGVEIQANLASNRPATFSEIESERPSVTFAELPPGSIADAPQDLASLAFKTGERVELATANCHAVEHSARRVTCALAVHQLALTTSPGAGCIGALTLRKLEFVRTESETWSNEDSISLCGGRLLRRTELYPVAINGQPRYALREEYQLIGGDKTCAAPYLQSRRPLQKSYTPTTAGPATTDLTCGKIAAR